MPSDDILQALRDIVGPDCLWTGGEAFAIAASDLCGPTGGPPPLALVRPADTQAVAAVVRTAAAADLPVAVRGGGMSYTSGYVPQRPGTVLIDTGALTTIHHEDPADGIVVVGAGMTWQALADHLAPSGRRSAVRGPISGSVSTVGGAAAQNIPGDLSGFLGVEVVAADGAVIRTGALALADGPGNTRHFGPDLTGLFLGDCGAFGIKTAVALRTEPVPEGVAFAGFARPDLPAIIDDILSMGGTGVPFSAMVLDPGRGASVGKVPLAEAIATLRAVAGTGIRGLGRALSIAFTGRRAMTGGGWSCHLTVEGETAGIARQRRTLLIRRVGPGARPVPATVPAALHARPFTVSGMVGPGGERWLPVHGVFAPSRARSAAVALERALDDLRPRLAPHGIQISCLVVAGPGQFVFEPMFLWPDALDPLHHRHLSARRLASLPPTPEAPGLRTMVGKARAELSALFDAAGATRFQIGRYYAYQGRLSPEGRALPRRIKHCIDPAGRMSPGNLGLASEEER